MRGPCRSIFNSMTALSPKMYDPSWDPCAGAVNGWFKYPFPINSYCLYNLGQGPCGYCSCQELSEPPKFPSLLGPCIFHVVLESYEPPSSFHFRQECFSSQATDRESSQVRLSASSLISRAHVLSHTAVFSSRSVTQVFLKNMPSSMPF